MPAENALSRRAASSGIAHRHGCDRVSMPPPDQGSPGHHRRSVEHAGRRGDVRLRSLRSSGNVEEYWDFRLRRERERRAAAAADEPHPGVDRSDRSVRSHCRTRVGKREMALAFAKRALTAVVTELGDAAALAKAQGRRQNLRGVSGSPSGHAAKGRIAELDRQLQAVVRHLHISKRVRLFGTEAPTYLRS